MENSVLFFRIWLSLLTDALPLLEHDQVWEENHGNIVPCRCCIYVKFRSFRWFSQLLKPTSLCGVWKSSDYPLGQRTILEIHSRQLMTRWRKVAWSRHGVTRLFIFSFAQQTIHTGNSYLFYCLF